MLYELQSLGGMLFTLLIIGIVVLYKLHKIQKQLTALSDKKTKVK